MVVVRVPKTPKKAFDKNRRPSALLLSQIEHLEWAVLPALQRKPGQLPKEKVKTEAQAAERVAQLTKMLLQSKVAAAPAPAAPTAAAVTLPPLPQVPTESPARKSRRRTKKSSTSRRRKTAKKSARRSARKSTRKTARSASRRRSRR